MTEPTDLAAEIVAASTDLARVQAEVAALAAEGETSSALVPLAAGNADAVKVAMAQKRSTLVRKQQELAAASERMRTALEAQQRALREIVDPLRKQVALMEEGIWTVNLYLGRDEEIVPLRDVTEAEPAPAGTPIVVRQQVLYMDEETMLDVERGGIDSSDITRFDEWVLADPAHLDQLLPEQRGIVALRPRRAPRRTEQRVDEDHYTHFLIRNGGLLYRLSIEQFDVGARLVPARDEFTSYFTVDRWGRPIEPGTRAWLEAEEAADKQQRHYMRVAMILQGLIDRTTVFHPLPAQPLSLLTPAAYNEGHVVMRSDEENLLTTGREPFRTWQSRLMAQVDRGMRIVGTFGYNWAGGDRDEHRITPQGASRPQSKVLHTVDRIDGGDIVIKYQRTDTIYSRTYPFDSYVPKTRASARLRADDGNALPFDLITVDECRAYLNDRTERHNYLDMVPLLTAAIELKEQEQVEEAPFRAALAAVLVRDLGLDSDVAEAEVDALVRWWKHSNRVHRPLAGDPEHEAKATRMIVKEARRRAAADRSGVEDQAVAGLRAMYPAAIAIVRRNDGTYVVYEPQPRQYAEGRRVPRDVFLRVHEYKGKAEPVHRDWVLLTPADARWRVLHETPAWTTWRRHVPADKYPTDLEIARMHQAAKEAVIDAGLDLAGVTLSSNGSYGVGPEVTAYGIDLTPAEASALPYSEPVPGVPVVQFTATRSQHGPNARPYVREGQPQAWGWRSAWGDDTSYPWRTAYIDDVLEQDERVLHQGRVEQQRRHDLNAPQRLIEERAGVAAKRLSAEWLRRWEAEQRARFDEDYGDPDLWEGHLKAMKRPENPVYTWAWAALFGRLLERNVEIDGMALAAAVDTYRLTVNGGKPVTLPSHGGYGARQVPVDMAGLDDYVLDSAPERPETDADPEPEVQDVPEAEEPAAVIVDAAGEEVYGAVVEAPVAGETMPL